MKHLIGMAKSFLDLKGAKSSKLELDYLSLVYAVGEIRRRGDSAQGYLVVLTPQISERAKQWQDKYRDNKRVQIIDISLPSGIKNRLREEKASNLSEMVAGVTGGAASGRSIANLGREISEDALKRTILRLEPKVKQVKDENRFPCGIRWDFYGVVD